MNNLSTQLTNSLYGFNQRQLTKGEVFILSKCISDSIPLMPLDETNVKSYLLRYRAIIDEVIYTLCNFTYLDSNKVSALNKTIEQFTTWRAAVAYNPSVVLFKDNHESTSDCVSLLDKYVDSCDISSINDVIGNANHLNYVFTTLVREVKELMFSKKSKE